MGGTGWWWWGGMGGGLEGQDTFVKAAPLTSSQPQAVKNSRASNESAFDIVRFDENPFTC